jgi:hypothetical protein
MPIVNDIVKKSVPGVVRPTLLYINSNAVIPAKAGMHRINTGFRVEPGMTI